MIVTLLIALVPLILKLGNMAIDLFVTNKADNAQKKTDFYNAIMKHANDALASVNARTESLNQIDELKKQAALDDAAKPPSPSA